MYRKGKELISEVRCICNFAVNLFKESAEFIPVNVGVKSLDESSVWGHTSVGISSLKFVSAKHKISD